MLLGEAGPGVTLCASPLALNRLGFDRDEAKESRLPHLMEQGFEELRLGEREGTRAGPLRAEFRGLKINVVGRARLRSALHIVPADVAAEAELVNSTESVMRALSTRRCRRNANCCRRVSCLLAVRSFRLRRAGPWGSYARRAMRCQIFLPLLKSHGKRSRQETCPTSIQHSGGHCRSSTFIRVPFHS